MTKISDEFVPDTPIASDWSVFVSQEMTKKVKDVGRGKCSKKALLPSKFFFLSGIMMLICS